MGVRSVCECLLTGLLSLLLLLVLLDKVSLLLQQPVGITNGLILDFVLKSRLVVLLLDLLLAFNELGDLLLDLRDVVLELIKLLLEVLAVLLGIIELFANLFNLSILDFDQWSQLVQFLIDLVTLAVKLVDLRLEFQ